MDITPLPTGVIGCCKWWASARHAIGDRWMFFTSRRLAERQLIRQYATERKVIESDDAMMTLISG
jgi:hypothetical protein